MHVGYFSPIATRCANYERFLAEPLLNFILNENLTKTNNLELPVKVVDGNKL
jgi:hypothetical protein